MKAHRFRGVFPLTVLIGAVAFHLAVGAAPLETNAQRSSSQQGAQASQREPIGSLTASGKAKVETSGTGETIGHVADLKIQNLTDQPLTCAIPPMILESGSGKNQHYACPRGQTVTVAPQQSKTVPMNGVCLNRNKPPVGKGVSGDLVMNEANPAAPQNPNSHLPATDASRLLQICTSKYDAAEKLQKEGALKNLPYRDPQKQKDIVVQWSTWTDPVICQMTGSPPATKEDLRKVVYKQVEEQGPLTPEKKKKVDQGIDTIFEKVELTTAKAKDLEKPSPVVAGPLSTEKPGPLFKPATEAKPASEAKPATVAQPGDVAHVESSPSGGAEHDGTRGLWKVKVKLWPSGEIVEVWFETAEKPPLKFCNWIKINKTHTDAADRTIIDDYEKTTKPTPAPKPPPTSTATATPPTVPQPTSTATQPPTAPQPPQPPGEKTEPEKPKGETVEPAEPWEPPDMPPWLKKWWKFVKPWWEGAKTGTGIVPTDVPEGKDALGVVIARLNKLITDEMAKGHDKEAEFYEKLKKKLTDVYNSLPNE
jgi:hypothetical protein